MSVKAEEIPYISSKTRMTSVLVNVEKVAVVLVLYYAPKSVGSTFMARRGEIVGSPMLVLNYGPGQASTEKLTDQGSYKWAFTMRKKTSYMTASFIIPTATEWNAKEIKKKGKADKKKSWKEKWKT